MCNLPSVKRNSNVNYSRASWVCSAGLRRYFTSAYSAPNLIVAAVGNVEHDQVRDLVMRSFEGLPKTTEPLADRPPRVVPQVLIRNKELEQSHVCLGTSGYQQDHEDRYSSYVLNTVLGGSMSSRLLCSRSPSTPASGPRP